MVAGPEIQEQLHQLPLHKVLLASLYDSAYKDFFVALGQSQDTKWSGDWRLAFKLMLFGLQ